MTSDTELREAVASSRTYTEAAKKLQLPYAEVYRRARKLHVKPIVMMLAESRRAAARAAHVPPVHELNPSLRTPVPEPEPVRLSRWADARCLLGITVKPDVVFVRLDQKNRVRAEVCARSKDFVSWVVRDSTEAVVGKIGLCPAINYEDALQMAKDGADAALMGYGWLRRPQTTPNACTTPTVVCAPAVRLPANNAIREKAQALLSAPTRARANLGVELAEMILTHVLVTQCPTA